MDGPEFWHRSRERAVRRSMQDCIGFPGAVLLRDPPQRVRQDRDEHEVTIELFFRRTARVGGSCRANPVKSPSIRSWITETSAIPRFSKLRFRDLLHEAAAEDGAA